MATQMISHYELLEILGEGEQGIVYRAWDPELKRHVAIKIFHQRSEEDWIRFQDAAKEISTLKHPHIAELWDVGRSQTQPFLVTEHLPGGTLLSRIRQLKLAGGVSGLKDILGYSLQIGEALVHAHRRGVFHRNLKAENVLFSENGVLKLTDFVPGSAQRAEDAVQTDVLGVGVLLHQLATGELPFEEPFDRFRADLPYAFRRVVGRILERDRPDCYRDLEKIVRDLKSLDTESRSKTPDSNATTWSPDRKEPSPELLNHDSRTLTSSGAGHRLVSVRGSSSQHSLSAGRLLAGRFRIVRFLARGGMGEVYEADDLELGERVALKTILPDIAGDELVLARFKREIQLARKVTHPNVCRIFDVFHHLEPPEAPAGSQEKITFLSMELLTGETLAERLCRTATMDPGEAWPIIIQMATALNAAHKAGVIHRDFKTSNVMLVPSNDAQDPRVVVTDFGLARTSVADQTLFTALSGKQEMIGTPAYIAPEQLEGGEITAAADIYAFGVVMFEMVTGARPFQGPSGLAVALKRLTEPAPSPRRYVADLDENWEKCILRCLERDPARRFSNMGDLLRMLGGKEAIFQQTFEAQIPGVLEQRGKRVAVQLRNRRRAFAGVGAFLLFSVLLGLLVVQNWLHAPGESVARRSVAVLGFRNLTGEADAAWLSTALAEMLTTELAVGEKVRAVSGENVARMKIELALPESISFAPDTLSRIRNYLGADVVISGSYLVLNGSPSKVRLDLRLQDSAKGDLLATISEEGNPAELLELVSRSGAQLREKLGVHTLEASEASLAKALLPASAEAARFYSEALEKLRLFDVQGARSLLENAIDADPRYALTHTALATSWSMSGYAIRAKEEAKKALELAAGLSREQQLLVEGHYRETTLEWTQAAEVYRTLFGFFPDNADYGLRLAAAQTSAGKPKDAIVTVETLRKISGLEGNSPRIDLAEARAAGALSDFKRQQLLASTAAAKGNAIGARLLVAGARLLEGSALANLGNLDQARAAFEESRRTYVNAGDRWDAANSATNLAYVLARSGDLDGARKMYEESLTTYNALGDRKGTAAVLVSVANLARSQANLPDAKRMQEQALAIYREVGDRAGEAMALNNIANVLGSAGDLPASQKMYEAALPVFREIGDRNSVATVLSNLADLLTDQGDLGRAAALYEESLGTFRDLGNRSALAFTLSRLADLLLAKGDLAAARKNDEEALALRKQLGEKGSVAESQLALAHVSLQEGFPVAAEEAAKAAVEQFRMENRVDDEASAMTVLARALADQGRNSEAGQAIKRAEDLSGKSRSESVRLSVGITSASIRAVAGDTGRATNELDGIVNQARKSGLVILELEARLALGQIEVADGRVKSGQARLAALEIEALRRGYNYIADRARAARSNILTPSGSKTKI